MRVVLYCSYSANAYETLLGEREWISLGQSHRRCRSGEMNELGEVVSFHEVAVGFAECFSKYNFETFGSLLENTPGRVACTLYHEFQTCEHYVPVGTSDSKRNTA